MRFTLEHEGKLYTYEIRKEVTTLGRDPQCDISLPTSTVSRFHAQCRRDGDCCILKDLGSRNGIWVNGAKIQEARLRDGDQIRLGKITIRFGDKQGPAVPKGFQPAPEELAQIRLGAPSPVQDHPTPLDMALTPEEVRQVEMPPAPSGRRVSPAPSRAGGLFVKLGRHWKTAAALMVAANIVFWGALAWKSDPEKKPEKPRERSPQERALALEKIAMAMEEARASIDRPDKSLKLWKQCRSDLEKLRQEKTDRIVSCLSSLIDTWEPVQPDYANFPWERYPQIAEWLGDGLADNPRAPERVSEIAKGWSLWLAQQVRSRAAFRDHDSMMLAEAGTDQWQQAYTWLMGKADRKSVLWPAYQKRIPELQRWIGTDFCRRAEQASSQKKWDEAAGALADAAKWWPLERKHETLKVRIESERAAEEVLRRALEAERERRFPEALELAQKIPSDSVFAGEAAKIVELSSREVSRVEIMTLFNEGSADQALLKLKSGPAKDPALERLIQKTQSAWTEALENEKRFQYDELLLKTGEILNALSDPAYQENRLRVNAQALRAKWSDPAQRARRCYEEGKACEARGRLAEAYGWWRRAQKEDPKEDLSQAWAAQEFRSYHERAQRLYSAAFSIQREDAPRAVTMLGEASAIVEPGSEIEKSIRKLLADLQSR